MIEEELCLDDLIKDFLSNYSIVRKKPENKYYYFNERYYQPIDAVELQQLFHEYFEYICPGGWNYGATKHMQNVLPTFVDYRDFRSSPNCIALNNGTLNLAEGTLAECDPHDDIRYHLNASFDSKAKCPVYDQFIKDVSCHDKKIAFTLNELLGYTMSDVQGADKMVLLIGEGLNGKSSFLKVVQFMLGEKATVTHFTPQQLEGKSFYLHDMRNSRMNLVHELPRTTTLEGLINETVKCIVTGDPVQAEIKGGESYEIVLPTKLIVASNHIPTIERVPDKATLRRYLVIPFNACFEGNIDRDIVKKMKLEKDGILNRAV